MNGQRFPPTSLNQILGLSQETAFRSSSPVVKLRCGFLIIGSTVQKESLSLVRRDGLAAGGCGGSIAEILSPEILQLNYMLSET